jgi:hypothetical protein
MQPPQQQFQQQQQQQQNMNQQQQFQQQPQPPQQQPQQQSQQSQQQSQQNQGGMGNDFMGLTPFNSLEMGSGIASDNYSMFSKDDNQSSLNSFFPHSYEIIGGGNDNGNGGPNPPPQQQSQQFSPPQPSFSGGNGGNSRSEQKQSAFEQEFAMKKAMRDQDGMGQQPARKVDGLPQNFNQMWDQGRK